MELALFVYLAGIVGTLGRFLVVTLGIGIFGVLVFLLVAWYQVDCCGRKFSEFYKTLRNACIGLFCLGIVASLIPSEKTMYMMLAGYTTQSVVQSETADKVVKVINTKLDEYLAEITTAKAKK